MSRLIILADVDPAEILRNQENFFHSSTFQILVLVGALLIAIAIGTIWAIAYSKKRRRPHRGHHMEQPGYLSRTTGKISETDTGVKVRKKWRRRRRPHRPMNPTLEQTGGLPPVRDINTPPPLP